jgi:hypothetical protein
VLELSGNACKADGEEDDADVMLQVKHVETAIQGDEELATLYPAEIFPSSSGEVGSATKDGAAAAEAMEVEERAGGSRDEEDNEVGSGRGDSDDVGSNDEDDGDELDYLPGAFNEASRLVDHPGAFAVGGAAELPQPLLRVEGVEDPLAWPLPQAQARELAAGAEGAAHAFFQADAARGKAGGKTVAARKLDLGNRAEWDASLSTLLTKALGAMGVTARTTAQLVGLHLDEGHGEGGVGPTAGRAGLDANDPFGLLLVRLPSVRTGCAITLRHEGAPAGEEQKVFTARAEAAALQPHYAAFYSACTFELGAADEGRGLTLVYRLVRADGGCSLVLPPSQDTASRELERLGRYWGKEHGAHAPDCPKLVYWLEGRYGEGPVEWDDLEGTDRAFSEAMQAACDGGACIFDVFVVTVEVVESGYDDDLDRDEFNVSGWAAPPKQPALPPAVLSAVHKLTLDDSSQCANSRHSHFGWPGRSPGRFHVPWRGTLAQVRTGRGLLGRAERRRAAGGGGGGERDRLGRGRLRLRPVQPVRLRLAAHRDAHEDDHAQVPLGHRLLAVAHAPHTPRPQRGAWPARGGAGGRPDRATRPRGRHRALRSHTARLWLRFGRYRREDEDNRAAGHRPAACRVRDALPRAEQSALQRCGRQQRSEGAQEGAREGTVEADRAARS